MTTDSEHDFTYAEYLRLDQLLDLQHSKSEHPDELQFIVVHQAFELWFKLVLAEMGRVRDAMQTDELPVALHLLNRVHVILRLLAQQILVLETMPPQDFHAFRAHLGSASGLQSFQFREVEVFSGLRDEAHLKFIEQEFTGHEWQQIARHLEQPSLREVWHALLERQGIEDVIALYKEPDAHRDLYLLAEALCEYDELVLRWRFLHIQLVERTIGGMVSGTGGTVQPYLDQTLRRRFFPGLWEVRNRLTAES